MTSASESLYPINSRGSVISQKPSKRHSLQCSVTLPGFIADYHSFAVGTNQCCSTVVQYIAAPVSTVWSFVRQFDNPQAYKQFLKSCHVIIGNGGVGSLREVHVVSGLPAVKAIERLEILDDERHIISFSIVGGEHRLSNYKSVTTLHSWNGEEGTVVTESYVVDIPKGNTREETCLFVDTIVKCNLQSLGKLSESLASKTKAS